MVMPEQHRGKAVACILFAIVCATMQDAIVKGTSAVIPAYETVIFRTVIAFPLLLAWLFRSSAAGLMFSGHMHALFVRSLILCSAYFAFVASIAELPLATAVSIYFTMPFFVAGLSGFTLGERTPIYRWIAIIFGFLGVLIAIRPSAKSLQPAHFFALYSAFGYAWGQMLGRKLSHRVPASVIANWQNLIYFAAGAIMGLLVYATGFTGAGGKSVVFLTRPWAWPDTPQLWLLIIMGLMSAAAAILFILAYRYAEASFVAPFEYSAIIWATAYGMVFFQDIPDRWNLLGTMIVISAGLFMLIFDRKRVQETG
jgi:drug/metabolite transporter (DMT)-like permease